MKKKNLLILKIVVPLILAFISAVVLVEPMSSPKTYKKTIASLEEKKETPVQDNQLSLDTTSANESNTEHSDTGQAVSHAPSATVNTYPQNTQQNAYVQPNTTPSYQSPTDNDENTVGTGGNDYERKQQY